jgi:TolB protein
MKKLISLLLLAIIVLVAVSFRNHARTSDSQLTTHSSQLFSDTIQYPEETHFKNVQQLTFGGDNAEAYWSYDSKYIVFQRTNPKEGLKCDQIFIGKVPQKPGDKFEYKLVSTGKGRTTCPFLPKMANILFTPLLI